MKKFKKLLAGLLAGAMMLGSMSATAFAAEGTDTPKMTAATIDTSLKGSLTIHKYEYNGTDTPYKGTGSENDKVPDGAKPLAGAGFTLYKVANADDLTKYYSTNPTDLPKVESYLLNGKIDNSKVIVTKNEVKTNDKGIATFTGLALGFYVVIETSTPDKVTTPAAPFLVSIPMTTVSGDSWLYDVHVYPKNKTTYGGVTLVKQGKDGAKLQGVTFVLQKKNTTTNKWDDVTTNESTGDRLNLVTDTDGKINVEGLSQGTYRFIETDRGNNYGYIMDGATAYQFTVNPNGTIKYGNETNEPAANITFPVTNEKPDMTKQVKDRTSGDWKQETDYNVGDMVPYKITVDVPSNITNLRKFTLTDTPTNLDDKLDTVNVTCENAVVEADPSVYSVEKEGEHGFKITFTPENMGAYAGKQLVITYNAELFSTAVTTTVVNTNSAKLEYSNKILPDTDDGSNPNKPGTPGKDSIKNTTIVYTFGLQVLKKAEKADGTPLSGVQFDLYKEVKAGTANAITVEAAKALGLDSNKKWLKINEAPLTTDKKGNVSQSGLANGTYYLVETKTNKEYNLLKAPVKVELNIEYETTTKDEWITDENNVKTFVKHEVTETKFKENNSSSNGIHTETIINKKGFTLPTTGSMGTIAITALGVALAFAGVLIIGASRKKTVK